MQVKTKMRYYLKLVRVLLPKRQITSAREAVEKFHIVGRDVNYQILMKDIREVSES